MKFAAWAQNLHMISSVDVWLGSKCSSTQRLIILKNRMKNDGGGEKWQGDANFYEHQNHILTYGTIIRKGITYK